MQKQPQITEKTRRKLIENFWKLYKIQNITKITVGNICENANYDRTTFYRYFSDISDILRELEDEVIESIKIDVQSHSGKKDTKNILFEGFNEFSKRYGEYLFTFYNNGNTSFYAKFKKLVKSDVYSYFKFNIENEDEKEFVYEFMFTSLINCYVYWYSHQKIMSLDTFVNYANSVITHGIDSIIKK